jgi:hypothetical protein
MATLFYAADLATDAGGDALGVDALGDVLAVSSGGAALPLPWTARPRLIDPGADIVPPFGGRAQRLGRLGARWSVTFSSLPAMGVTAARAFLAARTRARMAGDTCAFAWPQPACRSVIGGPVVAGAGQLGTSLAVSGLTPSTTALTAGTFFSLVIGRRSYLHALTADAVVSGAGAATLAIAPMLRASPALGAGLSFAAPVIDGHVQGHTDDWTLERLAWTGLPPFTVTEAQ